MRLIQFNNAGLLILCIILSLGCNKPLFKEKLPEILGIPDVEILNNNTITDVFGGFGEGYTLEVYELSKETVEAFVTESNKRLPDKKNWQKRDWSQTPIDTSYNEVWVMALNYYSSDKKLENHLSEIKQLVESTRAYYSFYYNPNEEVKEYIEDVQLFILDTESKQLYIIESNI